MCRGEARASQVTGSSSSCVLWSNTPPDTFPSSPVCRRGALLPSMESSTLGIREDRGFGAAVPRPARSSAYASPAVSPRPAQGWLPAWAGSPLAGQDSHLLDDQQSFMKASHPPIPFDPQGLVALHFLFFDLHGTTIEYGRLLAKNLEAVACALHHKDPVLIINIYRYWSLERLLTLLQTLGSRPASHHHRIQLHTFPAPLGQGCLASQLGDKVAIGIEHLQAVVLEVGHVNRAVLINGDSGRPIELPITLSRSAKLHQEPAVWGEFLNAVVAPIGYVHVPILV